MRERVIVVTLFVCHALILEITDITVEIGMNLLRLKLFNVLKY